MRKLLSILLFFFFVCLSFVKAQETELFAATQSGDPFKSNLEGSDRILWNYSLGVERYFADKISVSLSYRKPFFLGEDSGHQKDNLANGFEYEYTEAYDMFAIDLESKYFFDAPDDGWYLSSGISYQHFQMNADVISVSDPNGTGGISPLNVGPFSDSFSIMPITLKAGHRNSGDVFVFDYYFGLTYNAGSGNIIHQYNDFLQYDSFKSISINVGIKIGFKI